MGKSYISWIKHIILGVLTLLTFSSCGSDKNPEVIATNKKLENLAKKVKKIENNNTFPQIPKELLEPMIYLPSWKEAQIKLLSKRITIKAINTPLKDILNLISQATNLDVVYIENNKNKKIPLEDTKVTITVKNKKIKDVLDILSKVANFYYQIEKGSIIISDTQTKVYDVGIPKITSQSTININGNIFGTNENSISVGNLENSYQNIQNQDPYQSLKAALTEFLSPNKGKFYLDEDTGTLVVSAPPEEIKKIDKIVQKFKYFYSKEIDVKITILDYKQYGSLQKSISWQTALTKLLDGLKINYSPLIAPNTNGIIIQGSSIGTGPKIESLLFNFLNQIGTAKVLSSPRIRLTNGYSAIIISGEVTPYWFRQAIPQANGTSVYQYNLQNYINGYVLLLKARVNDQNQIYLVLTPVKNQILDVKSAPDGSQAPIVSTNILSTVLKLNDGDIAILGGLKITNLDEKKEGIPGVKDKILNLLTSSKEASSQDHQIIMIIQAKLVR